MTMGFNHLLVIVKKRTIRTIFPKTMHGDVKCDSVGVLVHQKMRCVVRHYTGECGQ